MQHSLCTECHDLKITEDTCRLCLLMHGTWASLDFHVPGYGRLQRVYLNMIIKLYLAL